MEKQQTIKGNTIFIDGLCTRIESWLLAQLITTVGTLLKKRQSISAESFYENDTD